jgi:hypothetical protein
MKRLELITLRAMQGLTIALGTMVVIAIGYACIQVATGNIHSSASFEF